MEFTLEPFRLALIKEPDMLPFGVGECIKDIFRTGKYMLPPPEKAVQSTLNNHMCRLGKKYNPDLINMAANAKDHFIFDSSRLFPLVSMEWLLAALELWFQHGHAMGWLGKKLEKKCIRIIRAEYGDEFLNQVLDIIQDCKEVSSLNWNYTLYEFVESYVCGVKSRIKYKDKGLSSDTVSVKRHTSLFINQLLNMFGFTWGAKELLDLEALCIDNSRKYAEKDACSMIYLTMISFIGPSSKHAPKKQ